ncbi:MAG: HXXEE domain-containing protein [Ignavibacteria bacterium]
MNFITKNWPKGGVIIAVLLLLYVYTVAGNGLPLLEKYAILSLAFLMFHQFEEYVLPGGFKDYFNNNIYNPLGFIRNMITDKAILYVNLVLGWGFALLVILFFNSSVIAVMTLIGIVFLNGILHFFTAFKTRYYNPGVVTGAILFIPLMLYSANKLTVAGVLNGSDWLKIIPAAFGGSLLIPLTIYLCREKRRR